MLLICNKTDYYYCSIIFFYIYRSVYVEVIYQSHPVRRVSFNSGDSVYDNNWMIHV